MLELEVFPERSLGNEQWEFILGMSLSQAIQILQQQANSIKGLQLLYSELNPLAMDVIINLSQDGIRLVFDPLLQRLKIIEVYNMGKVKLKYCGLPFNSPEVLPTIEQIEYSFGATHPGVYDSVQHLFILNFRGLSFSFPFKSKNQQHSSQPHYPQSLNFANGSSVVSRMAIYGGSSFADTKAPPLPMCCFYNHAFLDRLEVLRENNRTVGLKLYLITEALGPSKLLELKRRAITKVIRFGDTGQEVSGALGSPNKIFFKADDKMKIHSPNAHKLVTSRSSDYFYNYFTLGLDMLFDAKTHRVKKFILHTNFPGHYDFNIYNRCNFHIPIKTEKPSLNESIPLEMADKNCYVITAYSKWDEIQETFGKPLTQPVVLNRSSSTNTTNPFGSTYCYGYQDIIFEVMQNNHVASVALYQSAPYSGCSEVSGK